MDGIWDALGMFASASDSELFLGLIQTSEVMHHIVSDVNKPKRQ